MRWGATMKEKMYFKDFWGNRDLVFSVSIDNSFVAIGEVIGPNAERYIHISMKDFNKMVSEVRR